MTTTTTSTLKDASMSEFIAAKSEKKKILASGYTQSKRNMEIVSITAFCAVLVINAYMSVPYWSFKNLITICVASGCGMLGADWISGMLHWAADTWGTTSWPVVCD